MKHLPGYRDLGKEVAKGPLVKPGEGYQERIAVPSDIEHRAYLNQCAMLAQRNTFRLMQEREIEIESGLIIHQTPAMEESLLKLGIGKCE